MRELGFFFFLRMAVAVSFWWYQHVALVNMEDGHTSSRFSAPEGSLVNVSGVLDGPAQHLLAKVDLGFGVVGFS